jgi:hypothetical protein
MASRRGRVRELKGRVRPGGQKGLAGELGLVAAFLTQVVEDARSDNALLRTEARGFLEDEAAVRLWCSLAGIDTERFLDHVRACGPG